MDSGILGIDWPPVGRQEAEAWGLTPDKLAEVMAELNDHVTCLAGDAGPDAAEEVKEQLESPKARRKLAGAHVTDQVVATLNRWPTKKEWHELAWLGVWYLLIILSDYLVIKGGSYNWIHYGQADQVYTLADQAARLPILIWLLQAIARAGFFASFATTLWRAWRKGGGVLLARILQLKLIHTVLVVAALMLFGDVLWSSYFDPCPYWLDWPGFLTAPVMLSGMILAGLGLVALKRSLWAPALGLVLCGIFLYPGGPILAQLHRVSKPLACKSVGGNVYERQLAPDNDPENVAAAEAAWAARKETYRVQLGSDDHMVIDAAANLLSFDNWILDPPLGTYTQYNRRGLVVESLTDGWQADSVTVEPLGEYRVSGPITAPGGGLGWLAVPIPFLGIIGLLGMVYLLGRRGLTKFLLYLAIAVLAIISTVLPFFFGQEVDRIFELGPLAIMQTPFPGFEDLLVTPSFNMDASWFTLVGGLVFSAGVPWLMTALFLKERSKAPDQGTLTLAQ